MTRFVLASSCRALSLLIDGQGSIPGDEIMELLVSQGFTGKEIVILLLNLAAMGRIKIVVASPSSATSSSER